MQETIQLTQEKSFMKKLFEWKYIVPLIVLQSGLLYIILMAPGDISSFGILAFVVIFFISRKVSKDAEGKLISKRQYASFFTYLLVTIMIGVIISISASTVDSKREERGQVTITTQFLPLLITPYTACCVIPNTSAIIY